MKVLVLSIHPLYDNRIKRHINTLISNEIDVTYINASHSSVSEFSLSSNIKLIQINTKFTKKHILKMFLALYKMSQYIKKESFDVVHVHDPILLIFSKRIKKMRKKIIFDKHESFEKMNAHIAKVGTYFEKKYFSIIDGIVLVNPNQIEYIRTLGKKEYTVIPNYQSVRDLLRIQKMQNYPVNRNDNQIRIIYIGSLSNIDRDTLGMLIIMEKILKKYSNVSFILGGEIMDDNIYNNISRLKSLKNFSFLGKISHEEVLKETLEADIGLYFPRNLPNNNGSSPNKIFEYIMTNTSIVAIGNFMHYSEMDDFIGKVFPYNTEHNIIAEFLIKLIETPSLVNKYKSNCDFLSKKYTWENVEMNYLFLYKKVYNSKQNEL